MPVSVSVLSDSKRLGKTIAAARGWHGDQRPAFAKLLGTSDTTLLKWEGGDFSSRYRTADQRRQLAERVIRVSGCPAEWFELDEPAPTVMELLAAHDATLQMLAEHLDLQDEAELARASADVDRLFGSSSRTSAGSRRGAASA